MPLRRSSGPDVTPRTVQHNPTPPPSFPVHTAQVTGVTISRLTSSRLRQLLQDSVAVTGRVTAASQDALVPLQQALIQFSMQPEVALGTALLSTYGIMPGSVQARVAGIQSPPPAPTPPPQVRHRVTRALEPSARNAVRPLPLQPPLTRSCPMSSVGRTTAYPLTRLSLAKPVPCPLGLASSRPRSLP